VPRPRPHLRRLAPYEWEASNEDLAAAAGIPESAIVRFDTNTAPWPPVGWEQTVLAVPRLAANEYPHPSNEPLRSTLANRMGVLPEQVVVTAGADEALYLIASVFLGPRRRAVLPTPTFTMFRVVTETAGGDLVEVPLDEQWDVPRDAVLEAACQPGVSVVWLCSPNNPTGRLVDPAVVDAVAARAQDALVVVDEAYYEFAGVTMAPLLERHANLVILRTFSKGYGLAGARVGYAVGRPSVTGALDAVRPPQNLSIFSITAACRALEDEAGLRGRVRMLCQERARLQEALRSRGWEVVPSSANFLLGRPPGSASRLSRWLQGAGLAVRTYAASSRLSNWLRVTVRSPEENGRLLARMDELRAGK
jgi:histidinol-phosphate aminotransferase